MNTAALITANAARWTKCEITPSKFMQVKEIAAKITALKPTFDEVSTHTGVPWWFAGIVQYREADLDMSDSPAQGDPWSRVSRHVPKGRGPFKTYLAAAIDAFVNCPPYAGRWKDWSPGGALTLFEEYNGLGYESHHEASPYVWAATNEQQRGKYTSDGHWSASAWDTQLGCAAVLKAIIESDPKLVEWPDESKT